MASSLDIFKQSVREYVNISDQITRASKELAVVKRKKNELGDLILEFMQENKYDAVSADNATILKKSSTRKAGLKEEAILSAAKEFLGEHEVEKFMQKLDSTRETVTKEKINVKVAKQR
jgi:phosphopantothenate synthetase